MTKPKEEVKKGYFAHCERVKAEKLATEKTAKPKRKALSQKVRFEVFKRDSFSCQYCGRSAPDVILNADHINPVAKGGTNEIINLITSCFDCNSGKSDRELSDSSVLSKQKQQLDHLNERRNQIEMMVQWHESLRDMDSIEIDALVDEWEVHIDGYSLTASARTTLKKLLKKNVFSEIVKAMDIAADQYLKYDADDQVTLDSASNAFKKVGAILRNKDKPEQERQFYYIRGILRNRLSYINEQRTILHLKQAYSAGASLDSLTQLSKDVKNWTEFVGSIENFLENKNG